MSCEGPEAAHWRRTIYVKVAPDRTDLVGLMALGAGTDDSDLLALVADVARDALLVEGQISCVDADWLMEVCGDGRGLGSCAEFEALTSVLRHAAPPPAELVAFAAREIERAILTGERAFIGGQDSEPGRVTAGDVAALQDIRRAARPDRALAEVLFDIAHATATADNDPGFDGVFCETLRAYLGAEAPADMRFDEFLATLAQRPAPELPTPVAIDGMADARYVEAAEASSARCEAAARLPAPGARWALAHLSRGALSSAERRLVAALHDPHATATRRAA
jgi:hypothetical protein